MDFDYRSRCQVDFACVPVENEKYDITHELKS